VGSFMDVVSQRRKGDTVVSNPQRNKGFAFERETVKLFQEHGVAAERARGSDGRSIGEDQGVDLRITGAFGKILAQNKRCATVAKKYSPAEGVDIQVFRPDRGESMTMIRTEDFANLLSMIK